MLLHSLLLGDKGQSSNYLLRLNLIDHQLRAHLKIKEVEEELEVEEAEVKEVEDESKNSANVYIFVIN